MGTPTLGYPTRTAAVQALRAQGLSSGAIARKIGIEVKTVTALEASARRGAGGETGDYRGARSTSRQHTVAIDNDVLRALRPHAARRQISVNALVRQLLAILADDDLVDALLDDADEVRQ